MDELVAEVLKSNVAYVFANGALNKHFANKHPHELSLGHNLHKIPSINSYNPNAVSSLFADYPYKANLPIPLIVSENFDTAHANYIEDPALKIVKEKSLWCKNKQKFLNVWKRDKELAKKCSIKDKDPKCAKFLVDYAEFNLSDPDVNFNSTYNWYYTDGTLNIIEDNGINILLHNSSIFDNQISVTPIQRCPTGYEYHSTFRPSTKKLKHAEPIFQINSCRTKENIILGVRQKKTYSLFNVIADDTYYQIKRMNDITQTESLTSSCIDSFSQQSFALADVDSAITVYDLNIMKELNVLSLEREQDLQDKWLSVKYFESNIVFAVNRNNIYSVDLRADENQICIYKPEKDKCEEMSVFKFSAFHKNLLYVAGNHNLFSYDVRMFNQIQPLQRWTHGMKSTPHLMDVGIHDNKEIIILASPLHDELRLIVNTHNENDDKKCLNDILAQSFHLPWKPPTVADSLISSQLQGKMLKPDKYLSKRIKSCNAGLALIPNNTSLHIIWQNSFTDIFQQQIRPNFEAFCNEYAHSSLSNWSLLKSKTAPPLFATNIINMKPVFNLLKADTQEMPKTKKTQNEKWRRPLDKLTKYKDVLAQDILAPWNLVSGPIDNIPSQLETSEASTKEKVSAWLENSSVAESNLSEHVYDKNISQITSFTNFMSQPILPNHNAQPLITSSQPVAKAKMTTLRKRKYEGF